VDTRRSSLFVGLLVLIVGLVFVALGARVLGGLMFVVGVAYTYIAWRKAQRPAPTQAAVTPPSPGGAVPPPPGGAVPPPLGG
jgi:hypothetical protein